MVVSSVSFAAVKGHVSDSAMEAILNRECLEGFIEDGMLFDYHLRVLASMPSSTRKGLLERVAHIPSTYPEEAVDFCASAAAARVLMNVSGDTANFKLYEQYGFRSGHRDIHDDRKGADRFRNKTTVFAVFSERIMYGGDVLLPHLITWYNEHGQQLLADYMGDVSSDMRKCYAVYEHKKAAAVVEGIVDAPPAYEFMVAYQRYHKYFPIFMRIYLVAKKRGESKKLVDAMRTKGMDESLIMQVAHGQEALHDTEANSPKGKKKAKKLAKAMSDDTSVNELCGAVDFVVYKAPERVMQRVFELLGW